jgi:salicylate hydroxylase
MHRLAVDLGVTVKLVSRVLSYDVEVPSLTLENGSTVLADLIVAADGEYCPSLSSATMTDIALITGLKSSARRVILGDDDCLPERTGFVAYRTVVDVEHVKKDPQVSWLLEKPSFNLWLVTQ